VPKTTLTVGVKIGGLREALTAFRELPKEANDALRDEALKLSQELAVDVQSAARSEGHQAALLAQTVKAKRDRVPVITAGGTTKLGHNRKPAYKLLFGSEFGSSRLKQYKPHRGRQGYWFFPVVEKQADKIAAGWQDAAQRVIDDFSGGPS